MILINLFAGQEYRDTDIENRFWTQRRKEKVG